MPATVLNFPAAPTPKAVIREAFSFDAALPDEPGLVWVPPMPFAFAMSTWNAQIQRQALKDVPIESLHGLGLDHRDGALCRGQGGACYTPHAWSQLVSLMRARGAPAGVANVARWSSPLARHHLWADITARSLRPRGEEGILRMFMVPDPSGRLDRVNAIRAVVSGRHSQAHFDDAACLKVIEGLEEKPVQARIVRGWDITHATFDLDAGNEETGLAFYLRNSETGCASLSFSAALRITALDSTVVMPSGERFERVVRIAAEHSMSTRRRHTLPRYSGSSGSRLSEIARSAIAGRRIGEDLETAMTGARVLAGAWKKARVVIKPELIPVAKAATVDDTSVEVLADVLLAMGVMPKVESRDDIKAFCNRLARVMAEDSRLKSLPHGSMAHLSASLAVLATDGEDKSYERTVELQRMSGRVLMSVLE